MITSNMKIREIVETEEATKIHEEVEEVIDIGNVMINMIIARVRASYSDT